MKIEMSESLIASWLKHVKHCIVVNTNWKASPYWTPVVPDVTINQLCCEARNYFDAHQLLILDGSDNQGGGDVGVGWQSMLLLTECDIVGLAHSGNHGGTLVYAVESAFHRGDVQYSKRKSSWTQLHLSGATVTAWNVALKMFKNALSMYRWYGVQDAHIVFVAPMSSERVEGEILNACNLVRDFYTEHGFHFAFEFYFEHATPGLAGSFAEEVKAPVNLAATIVNDTSELYMRGHILDEGIQGIDVLMLDRARSILSCESLDELAGLHLNAAADIVDAVAQIGAAIITVTSAENQQLYKSQKSLFDRCQGALRAYYSALHEFEAVPTLAELRRAAEVQHTPNVNVAGGQYDPPTVEISLNPADVDVFKQQLLITHLARRTRVFGDGRPPIVDEWRADSLTVNSNLMGNIKSSRAYRRANHDGVVRLEFSVVTQTENR